jgi:hypothetical protein
VGEVRGLAAGAGLAQPMRRPRPIRPTTGGPTNSPPSSGFDQVDHALCLAASAGASPMTIWSPS